MQQSQPATTAVDEVVLEHCDGSGLALLHFLNLGMTPPGTEVPVGGLRPEFLSLFQEFTGENCQKSRPRPLPKKPGAEEVGEIMEAVASDLKATHKPAGNGLAL